MELFHFTTRQSGSVNGSSPSHRFMNDINFVENKSVGWVKRSETHLLGGGSKVMGFRFAQPSYKIAGCSPSHCLIVNLLPEAEISENHIEQILDVGPAGDMAEAAPGEAQVLGAQFGEVGVE